MSNLLKVLAKLSGECSLEKNTANLMFCLAPAAEPETPGLCLECLRARQHFVYMCLHVL